MPSPPLFLCPRLFTHPARHLPPYRALSTLPNPSSDTPVSPTLLSADAGRPTASTPSEPPLSIEHHDAPLPSSRPPKYTSGEPRSPQVPEKDYGYHIGRTARGGEPVYEGVHRGGRERTLVRLIHGDSDKLRKDLIRTLFEPLGVPEEKLQSRIRLGGNLEFRGHWRGDIVGWMRQRGL